MCHSTRAGHSPHPCGNLRCLREHKERHKNAHGTTTHLHHGHQCDGNPRGNGTAQSAYSLPFAERSPSISYHIKSRHIRSDHINCTLYSVFLVEHRRGNMLLWLQPVDNMVIKNPCWTYIPIASEVPERVIQSRWREGTYEVEVPFNKQMWRFPWVVHVDKAPMHELQVRPVLT